MSSDRLKVSVLTGPDIIHHEDDLLRHDPRLPALLMVPASLVKPLWRWFQAMLQPGPPGKLARAFELLLLGVVDRDQDLQEQGLQALRQAQREAGGADALQYPATTEEILPVTDEE